MKMTGLVLCLACAAGPTAFAAQHLWESFDAFPAGSIAVQTGWTRAVWLGTQTAQVSSAQSYSPANALELPWHAAGSSAVYTNFTSTYVPGAEHPVVRFSAKYFLDNTNTPFQIGLRNSAAGIYLSFQNDNGRGAFGITHAVPGFIPLVTGFFVDVTAWYNRSNNTYRLDHDNAASVLWGPADDPTTHTQFNQFLVTRLTNTAGSIGGFFVDDVSVETFPPHVWAWWRCTSFGGTAFNEQLGTFYPAYRSYVTDNHRPGSYDPVWDGTDDFRNVGAGRHLVVAPAPCVSATSATSNWTVEAVFQIAAGEGNVSFIDWGRSNGFNTNQSWISFGYLSTFTTLYFNVRDAEQADAGYAWGQLGAFAPDGRWHHAALVKSNDALSVYLDYQLLADTTFPLLGNGNTADGTYTFDTLSRASIGRSLNGGNECGNGTVIDEVRVSGKALALSEFLQPGPPLIVDVDNSALLDPWELTMKGILGKTYHVETSSTCGTNANWQLVPGSAFVANYTFNFVDVPNAVPRTNFVRIVRDD